MELVRPDGSHVEYGYTDENGHFSIPGIDPAGGLKARLLCYIKYGSNPPYDEIRVVSQGDSLTGLTNIWCSGYTNSYEWDDDGGVHFIGDWEIVQGCDEAGAFWIKDDMDRAYRYPATVITSGSCTAKWTPTSTEGTGAADGRILLLGADMKAPDVILHEYAHVSMAHINPVNVPPVPNHGIEDSSSEVCAWVEGWAEFFPLVVNGNPTWTHRDSTSEWDFESQTWNNGWDDGDDVEGRVAGALWDLYDDEVDNDYPDLSNHFYDQFNMPFSDIWATFCDNQTSTTTFDEFWDKLKSRLPTDKVPAARSVFQNTIIYPELRLNLTTNVSPSLSGTISKNPDNANYEHNENIALTAHSADEWTINGWTGVDSSNGDTAAVAMDFDKTITANFAQVPDVTDPATVTDLAVDSPTSDSLRLLWTAPGDNGSSGTASQYDIRYSTSAILDETDWNNADQASVEPAPSTAGSSQSFTLGGLNDGTTYYVALKTADEVPNWSDVSNCANGTTTKNLSGWANRIEISIDHTKIDENLTHFPVLIHLSSNSGINGADMTDVFDEVGGNSKKIAITKDDGETQLYVEIDKWNSVNEEADLWVSRDDWIVSSTVDTHLYLYYDNSQPDNTAYIGEKNSTSAENVWDDNYKLVMHLEENGNGTAEEFKDSTSNHHHGASGKAGYTSFFEGNKNFDIQTGFYQGGWKAWTFTPEETHIITLVRLMLHRDEGTAGDVILSIKATDIDGRPTGSDLRYASVSVEDIPIGSDAIIPFYLNSSLEVQSGLTYAGVVRAPHENNDTDHRIWLKIDTANNYDGGWLLTSSNAGQDWSDVEGGSYDAYFENRAPGISEEAPASVDSKIGDGPSFDGVDDYIVIPDSDDFSLASNGGRMTVSFWFSPSDWNLPADQDYNRFIGKGDPGEAEWHFRFYSYDYEGDPPPGPPYDHTNRTNAISQYHYNPEGGLGTGARWDRGPLESNTWAYVTGVFDYPGDSMWLFGWPSEFKQGKCTSTDPYWTFSGDPENGVPQITPQNGSGPIYLAYYPVYPSSYCRLDEFRLADVVRSDAWVQADYYSQNDDLLTYGDPPSVITVSVDNVAYHSATLHGNLTDLGSASSVDVSFLWDTESHSANPEEYPEETSPVQVTSTGSFSFNLTDLNAGTDYYFRVKAVGYGITYGNEMTFSTPEIFPTTTTVTSSANPSTSGQSVTFTATITSPGGTPTGSVQFKIDSSDFGTPKYLNNGIATSDTASTLSIGNHSVTADYYGEAYFNSSLGMLNGGQTVNGINLTVTGITAYDKVYDGSTTATLNTSNATLVGVVPGDTVILNTGGATGAFINKNVGTDKIVNISGLTISGEDAGNYTLIQPVATSDITPRNLTVTASGVNKIYDGSTVATANLFDNRVHGDCFTLNYGSANFTDKNIGADKTVNVSDISITDGAAFNYTLGNTTAVTTADITVKTVTPNINVSDKVYDGTNSATITERTLEGAIPGDNISLSGGVATFDTPAAGTGKTVNITGLSLSGTDTGNYQLSADSATTTASIDKLTPSFSGLSEPAISQGASPTSLGGIVNAEALIPSGSVSITLTGVGTQSASINETTGAFSSSFNTSSLTSTGSPYAISYSYPGDTNFNSLTDNTKSLTVNSSEWANRLEIIIDHNKIDSNLSHFPILIHLSASSGTSNTDVTAVFEELGNNSKKIKVTEEDEETQLYVEIEKWDNVNEEAWLWVSRSGWSISSSEDTILYIFYDNNQDDNTSYVGDTSSTPAESVWESNFAAVYHMQDYDSSHIHDSTANHNHGTKTAANQPQQVDGTAGKAQRFDGSNDIVDCGTGIDFNQSSFTYEAMAKSVTADCQTVIEVRSNPTVTGWRGKLHWPYSSSRNALFYVTDSSYYASYIARYINPYTDPDEVTDGNYYYLAGVANRSVSAPPDMYKDGVLDNGTPNYSYCNQLTHDVGGGTTYLGGDYNSNYFQGDIDEIRISKSARSAAWIKATNYTLKDDLVSYGSGSSEWSNRLEITIDHNNIDSNLSHFPVLIHLSSNCGITGADMTSVFDEVGSNSKKIAVTEADGETQLYVEIEKWDSVNEEAWLWVSRDGWTISSVTDTTIFLYYNNNHADNTAYVGDINSDPAENVWDADFAAVYHLKDGEDNAHVYDSTGNNRDGTKKGANEPQQAMVATGYAQQFDGSDDYIDTGSGCAAITGNLTIEASLKRTATASAIKSLVDTRQNRNDNTLPYELALSTSERVYIRLGTGSGNVNAEASTPVPLNEWSYVYGSISGNNITCGLNTETPGTATFSGTRQTGTNVTLGMANLSTYRPFTGLEDEMRISTIARSAAWLKATNYTIKDYFISLSAE